MPTLPLGNRLALVTGASGSIGAAVARRLARDGASVLAHYGSNREAAEDFNVNVRALFQLSREAARRMTKVGWGRIITMGSVFGEAAPAPGLSMYCGTKFAVRGLTRAWSRDLGPAGITVNNVQPAVIQPEPVPTHGPAFEAMKQFTSVGRFGKPEEIAEAVAFLANPAAAFINGESLTVDGGWSA